MLFELVFLQVFELFGVVLGSRDCFVLGVHDASLGVVAYAFDCEVVDLEVGLAVDVREQLVHFGELEDPAEQRLLRRELDAVAGSPLLELECVDGLFFDETEVVVLSVGPSRSPLSYSPAPSGLLSPQMRATALTLTSSEKGITSSSSGSPSAGRREVWGNLERS